MRLEEKVSPETFLPSRMVSKMSSRELYEMGAWWTWWRRLQRDRFIIDWYLTRIVLAIIFQMDPLHKVETTSAIIIRIQEGLLKRSRSKGLSLSRHSEYQTWREKKEGLSSIHDPSVYSATSSRRQFSVPSSRSSWFLVPTQRKPREGNDTDLASRFWAYKMKRSIR